MLLPAQLAAVTSGATQMFGANLGSWLVLEGWMVPDIFAIVPYGLPYGEQQLMTVSTSSVALIQTRSLTNWGFLNALRQLGPSSLDHFCPRVQAARAP